MNDWFMSYKTGDIFSICPHASDNNYSVFTETGATQTMKTNQKAELKQ